ncbi:EF-hand domain-containing protein [Roseovarius aestuariivivens]|uniref:EF-hand domain-containing protein n=1 Tax=Roseovarius aestuariivivens TaxID=1888910 RepID=UPI00107FE220|nr:EF-hand domain-containing protein [Roseovarius aestuariivivens]
MKTTMWVIAALAALVAAPSFAATPEDTDGNGSYSMDEVAAAYPDLTEEDYAEIDLDASGDVSAEELTTAMESGLLAE